MLDIDPALLEFTPPPQEGLIEEARIYIENSLLWLPEGGGTRLPVGGRVRHAVFGSGSVISVDEGRSAYAIQFDGMETPRSISFRVKLEVE